MATAIPFDQHEDEFIQHSPAGYHAGRCIVSIIFTGRGHLIWCGHRAGAWRSNWHGLSRNLAIAYDSSVG